MRARLCQLMACQRLSYRLLALLTGVLAECIVLLVGWDFRGGLGPGEPMGVRPPSPWFGSDHGRPYLAALLPVYAGVGAVTGLDCRPLGGLVVHLVLGILVVIPHGAYVALFYGREIRRQMAYALLAAGPWLGLILLVLGGLGVLYQVVACLSCLACPAVRSFEPLTQSEQEAVLLGLAPGCSLLIGALGDLLALNPVSLPYPCFGLAMSIAWVTSRRILRKDAPPPCGL